MRELYSELQGFIDTLNKDPKCFKLISRAHEGSLCNFYINPNIEYIMDNPERRVNFGLLAGNSKFTLRSGLSIIYSMFGFI